MPSSFPISNLSIEQRRGQENTPPPAMPRAAIRRLEEVERELQDRAAGFTTRPYPIEEIRFQPDRVVLGHDSFVLTEQGTQNLCKLIRAPWTYIKTLDSKMTAALLNHHFQRQDYKPARLNNDNTLVAFRGGEFVALIRAELPSLPAHQVVAAVREGINAAADSVYVPRFAADDDSFAMEVVSDQVAAEVRPGDILHAGLRVQHSTHGAFATRIEAFILRLLCANGLTRVECVRRDSPRSTPRTRRLDQRHGNSLARQLGQIIRHSRDAWQTLEPKLDSVRGLRDRAFDWDHLATFSTQAHFSAPLRDRLRTAWAGEGSEPTAFGALNAFTRLATHDAELSPRQRFHVERVAGMFAGHEARVCPHCLSILRQG